MTEHIDSEWLRLALNDASEKLSEAIALIDSDPRKARGVLEHEIPELYAKLNFAVNTASTGPGVIDEIDHNELIAWPTGEAFEAFEYKPE